MNTETESFKLVYKQNNLWLQWAGIDYLKMENSGFSTHYLELDTNSFKESRTRMRVDGISNKKPFVIENVSPHDKVNCSKTGLVDLNPEECYGQVQLRKLRPEE